MNGASSATMLPRAQLASIADGLVAAVAISLPWSTSATAILVVLWLAALVPTLDPAAVRCELRSAAGGLPVLLWALGAVGMLWADVSWSERLAGWDSFHKLLAIPLLLAQFRRPGQAQWGLKWTLLGFLASSVVLLAASWFLVLTPGLTWRGKTPAGVPVKDYILQSAIFASCAFGLLEQAAEHWRARPRLALAAALLAAAFVANIIYVATGRTTLVVMVALLLLFGFRRFDWKGALGACLIGGVLAGGAWESSPYLRQRVARAVEDVEVYSSNDVTSVGLRFEYWRKSVAFISEAPVIGHGTGTIPSLFRREWVAGSDPMLLTTNPHNQILAVAIEIGLLGVVVLVSLWIAHLALFRAPGPMTWFGLVIVVQNILGSLFNSFLFDFTQGWLYVFGVGAIGGAVLRARGRDPDANDTARSRPTIF